MIQDFDEFWKLYPNKKSKWYARVAYAKALKITTSEAIMEWLRKYNNHISIKWVKSEYIKHPASWLNAECREDNYVIKATVTAPKVEKEVIPEMTAEQRQSNLKRLQDMKANLQSKPTNDRTKTVLSEVMDRV